MISQKQLADSAVVDCPDPGIYLDVPFETYLSWPAVSNSRLNMARRSLLHFREQVIKETEALRLGRFIHCGVLEPLAIPMRYVVMPSFELDPDNVTKAGKPSTSTATDYYDSKVKAFKAANEGKEIVDKSDYDILIGISKGLMRSPKAKQYLSERGDAEVSMVWIDKETGLRCKARADLLNSGINDLKSCQDCMGFAKSIATYGYHRQAAHYIGGYRELTGETKPFRLIAVEKTSPFGVRAAELNEDAIDVGESEVREAMRSIAEAYELNQWPCYEDPTSWCLPSYYVGNDEPIELTIGGQKVTI